ncbi:MAG: DUF3344 domain-containing protein, partial [Methanolinea sp.]
MNSREILLFLLLLLLAPPCTVPVAASYAGDRPLTLVFRDTFPGGFAFSQGDGGYSGSLGPGEAYMASVSRSIPGGALVRFERLYVYWTWSRIDSEAAYPAMEVRMGGRGGVPLTLSARYADSKGFASRNDFFSGTDSYILPVQVSGNFTVCIVNTAGDGRTFAVQGIALLTVYEEPSGEQTALWVAEGADLLYRSYGIPPALATTRVDFPGRVDIPRVRSARLLLVAPSAGFSREDVPEMNILMLNTPGRGDLPPLFRHAVRLLFPRHVRRAPREPPDRPAC